MLIFFSEVKIKSLDKSLLKELIYKIDPLDINSILFLLKYIPEEFEGIIKRYNNDKKYKRALKKIIKKFNIKEKYNNEIIQKMEQSNINGFLFGR